ncbi:MAG: enoyl-ACP reductase FabI [Solirubrobacterales bacterium]
MIAGKRVLLTGVVTRESIAFETARLAQSLGAEVVLTSFGRVRRMTERTARALETPVEIFELDVRDQDAFAALADDLSSSWGGLDAALHAIAYAPKDAIGGEFLTTPLPSAIDAFSVSAFSLKALGATLAPLFPPGNGSLVGLDFDATVAWPAYDWMGVAKAALESTSRYLARDLGPRGTRVNLVAAGPLDTAAAGGIAGFNKLSAAWAEQAPLGWDPGDSGPVASTICFLMSDHARAITGEIVHVDGGFHAMGAGVR